MQAGPRLRQPHLIADARRQRVAQHDLALRVLGAHALDVVREMAVRHEIRQRRLQMQLPRPIDAGAGPRERLGHLRRHHHVAHAQAGEHGLAEGAQVDHAAVGVQALQRRDRRAVVAELAVVVVLQHPQAARPRRLQQLQAPRQRHHHAGRVLMRRTRDQQPRPARQLAGRQVQALVIEHGGMRAHAGRRQHRRKGPVAGTFHQRGVAPLCQHTGAQINRLVRARRDDDLLRLAHHRARQPQVAGDGLAQRQETRAVLGVARQRQVRLAQVARHQPAPQVERKQAGVGHARHERAGVLAQPRRAAGDAFAARGQARHVALHVFGRGRRQQRPVHGLLDEGAAAAARAQVVLGDQPLVGQRHRDA
jgi:hypothetical protein